MLVVGVVHRVEIIFLALRGLGCHRLEPLGFNLLAQFVYVVFQIIGDVVVTWAGYHALFLRQLLLLVVEKLHFVRLLAVCLVMTYVVAIYEDLALAYSYHSVSYQILQLTLAVGIVAAAKSTRCGQPLGFVPFVQIEIYALLFEADGFGLSVGILALE